MNNKFSRLLIILALFVAPLYFSNTPALGADLDISCTENGGCTTNDDPLFSTNTNEHFYPGLVLTKTVNLENNSASTRQMFLQPSHNSGNSLLESMMTLSILDASHIVLWSGSLTDLYNTSSIDFGSFSAYQDLDYQFKVSLPQAADNNFANLNTNFDLSFSFISSENNDDGNSNGDIVVGVSAPTVKSGTDGGTNTPPPYSCNDQPPASAPVLLTAVAGANFVTLTWQEATSPLTYYLVAYGEDNNAESYGNPNAGGPGTNSYTISGLSGDQTYSFKVRAGNGCAPGEFSNIMTATPTGIVLADTVAQGFEPNILGEATESAQIITHAAEKNQNVTQDQLSKVKGAATCSNWLNYLPWLILAIQALLLIAWEFIGGGNNLLIKIIVPVIFTVLAVTLLHFLKTCDCYQVAWISFMCAWSWLISILITLVTRIIGHTFLSNHN